MYVCSLLDLVFRFYSSAQAGPNVFSPVRRVLMAVDANIVRQCTRAFGRSPYIGSFIYISLEYIVQVLFFYSFLCVVDLEWFGVLVVRLFFLR